MLEYEINSKTYALIALNETETEVIEEQDRFVINNKATKIVENSCEFYGCSLQGRQMGSKKQLGMKYKLPVILENTKELIFFPTVSPRLKKCSWISPNNIKTYEENKYGTIIEFNNGIKIQIEISLESLETQLNKAARLMFVSRERSKMKK